MVSTGGAGPADNSPEVPYRRIVEAANLGIWALDPEGATTFANRKMSDILGYPAEEMATLTLFDVLDEQGKAQAARNLERRRRGESAQIECAFLRKDGAQVWLLVNASPLLDERGGYVGALWMASEITERKRVEALIQRGEQQLAAAQRVAHLGSWEWDVTTDQLSWSDELYRIFGLEPGELTPTYAGYLAQLHPDDVDMVNAAVGAAMHGGGEYQFEHRLIRKDGEIGWIRSRGKVVFDETGAPLRLHGTGLDITASKRTEEALQHSSARNRLLRRMATAANEASGLEELLQVALEEIRAHTGWNIGHARMCFDDHTDGAANLTIWSQDPELLQAQAAAMEAMRRGPLTGLVGEVLATGSAAWTIDMSDTSTSNGPLLAARLGLVGGFCFPVLVGAQVTCVLEFLSDRPIEPDAAFLETINQVSSQLARVAERQRAGEELASARDAAMEASRLKSEFLATMSHEIRTPMNGVIGLTGLLLGTQLDVGQRQYAEGVQVAGEALLTIINDLLDFSKIEAGKLDLETVDFDVVRVVEEVAGLMGQSARQKGLRLVTLCAPDLPTAVLGDPARLRQVLLNLSSNAVKFTEAGEITLRARRDPSTSPEGSSTPPAVGNIRFEVIDSGIGIAEGDVLRMFEPFAQADASTTRRFGGTGLGLAISRRLVRAMGGDLGVDSEPGRGSTFWFRVPLPPSPAIPSLTTPPVLQAGIANGLPSDAPRALSAPEGADTRRRVLVVEDSPINQMVACGILKQLGYGADIAADGLAALEALQRTEYVAILMDCQMPRMDGYSATGEIRSREGGSRHTPVIAMTAGAIDGDRERCLAAGMDDYISKPVKPKAIESALDRWVGAALGEAAPVST